MDCDAARQLLSFARPRCAELDAAELHALETHLADCPACAALSRRERETDDRLTEMMQAVPVPIGLRDRLQARLAAERSADRRRRFRRVAALAAALLLPLTVGLIWTGMRRPALDTVQLADLRAAQVGASREWVEAHFRENGFRWFAAPTFMNYSLLQSYELNSLDGRVVPVLRFVRDDAVAEVYVVRTRQFTWVNDGPVVNSSCTVQTRVEEASPELTFVIVTTGGHLEPFLTDDIPPVA